MYDGDYDYADSRLRHTVVRLDGKPVFVHAIHEDGKVDYQDLLTGNHNTTNVEALDCSSPPLGFVNYQGNVSYIVRRPMRRDWRQGLRHNNMASLYGRHVQEIPWDAISHTIMNNYPPFKQCFMHMKAKQQGSEAWCREFAVAGDLGLLYAGQVVGRLTDDGQPIFEKGKEYLIEAFEESL